MLELGNGNELERIHGDLITTRGPCSTGPLQPRPTQHHGPEDRLALRAQRWHGSTGNGDCSVSTGGAVGAGKEPPSGPQHLSPFIIKITGLWQVWSKMESEQGWKPCNGTPGYISHDLSTGPTGWVIFQGDPATSQGDPATGGSQVHVFTLAQRQTLCRYHGAVGSTAGVTPGGFPTGARHVEHGGNHWSRWTKNGSFIYVCLKID